MTPFWRMLVLMLCVSTAPAVAGPAEEIAEINLKRGQAFSQGNAEAFTADFADNAVFTSSISAFRIEGKTAIRAFFASLFQTYPQRQNFPRQGAVRFYANETIAVANAYSDQTWVDKSGKIATAATRSSVTWAKIDGKWLTIDFHISRVPGGN